jgi:hypothetical protein
MDKIHELSASHRLSRGRPRRQFSRHSLSVTAAAMSARAVVRDDGVDRWRGDCVVDPPDHGSHLGWHRDEDRTHLSRGRQRYRSGSLKSTRFRGMVPIWREGLSASRQLRVGQSRCEGVRHVPWRGAGASPSASPRTGRATVGFQGQCRVRRWCRSCCSPHLAVTRSDRRQATHGGREARSGVGPWGIGRLRGTSRKQRIAVLIGVSAAQGGEERQGGGRGELPALCPFPCPSVCHSDVAE